MHRSSLVATPKTGCVEITEDDKRALLEPLTRYGRLDSRHLVSFDERHFTTTYQRLNKYFHETAEWKVADKPILRDVAKRRKSFNEPAYYFRGPSIFRDLNYDDQTKRILEATVIGPHDNEHDISLARCVSEIEVGVRAAGLRFITHLDIIRKSKSANEERPLTIPIEHIEYRFKKGVVAKDKTSLRPDAVFGIEYPQGIKYFAVERDRGNETFVPTNGFHQTSWLEKVLCYEAASKGVLANRLGIPKLHILAIMETDKRAQNLIKDFPHIHAIGVKSHSRPDDYYFKTEWTGKLKLGEA